MSMGFRPLIQHGLRRGLPSKSGFSRRTFLRLGAGAAATLAVGSALGPLGCGTGGRDGGAGFGSPRSGEVRGGTGMRIAVVGAGLAGLACADTLTRGGAEVVVFEASRGPGGRVLTDRRFIPGRSVELGAEFIGENHPTWIAYADRFGIALEPAIEYDGETPVVLGGRLIRGEAADSLYAEFDAVAAHLIEMARPVDPVRPWISPGAARLDRMTYADYLGGSTLSADARQLLGTLSEADNGVPPQRQSMLAYLAMIAGGGFRDYFEISETHRAQGGNDALASALAQSMDQRVRYGTAVLGIHRTAAHAVVHTSDGRTTEADAVVVAVPPSVWHKIAFDYPLNGRVPQMGKNVKLITKVRSPVWEADGLAPEAVSDGLVHLTWVSADGGPGKPGSMTLFSGGRSAEQLRGLNPKVRTMRAIGSLRAVYPQLDRVVTHDRFIDWPGMSNALASYSFPAPGEVTRYGPTLVDGLNDGRSPLRLAGEHTSYGFIGYMEGALQSGVRVAESLLAIAASQHRPASQARSTG
jgi:monoamine oxidase